MYDFTTLTERRGTLSAKWDNAAEGVIPAFVADMDFTCPPEAIQAMQERLSHGVFGYMSDDKRGWELQIDWWKRYHGLEFTREEACYSAGCVPAQVAALLAISEPGDPIVMQYPIYPPFIGAVKGNDRVIVNNPLIRTETGWDMDLADLEEKFKAGSKVFLLCAPHNPVGRIWTAEEMTKLAELCAKYDIWVVSDEIHGDLELPGSHHTSYAAFDSRRDKVITLIAPTKTFNLAGLHQSTIVCPNQEVLKKIKTLIGRTGASGPNIFGQVAQNACYEKGRAWLEELMEVIQGNIEILRPVLEEKGLWFAQPTGTYIIWVDGTPLGRRGEELVNYIKEVAGVGVTNGADFGDDRYFRVILATQPDRVRAMAEGFKKL